MQNISRTAAAVALWSSFLSAAGGACAGTLTTLHSFSDKNDGAFPGTNLTYEDGLLYGTTGAGGLNKCGKLGCGEIFSVDPSTGATIILYSFSKTLNTPSSTLMRKGSALYGTVLSTNRKTRGSIFELTLPSLSFSNLYSFGGNLDSDPRGDLAATNDLIYGTTSLGGPKNNGTLYSFSLRAGRLVTLHTFETSMSDGGNPDFGVTFINGSLYGTTVRGGSNGNGILFKYDLVTSAYTVIYSFTGTDGSGPSDALISDGTYLYGMTYDGGAQQLGTVFKFDIGSGHYQNLYTFTDERIGAYPVGSTVLVGQSLYGITQKGGASDKGTIFKLNTVSGEETLLYSFKGGSDGESPAEGLIYKSGVFYGVTSTGGTCCGTVFKFVP